MIIILRLPSFLYRSSLQVAAVSACMAAGVTISVTTYTLHSFLSLLTYLGARVDRDLIIAHKRRERNDVVYEKADAESQYMFVDEKSSLSKSNFPVKAETLIANAKKICATKFGTEDPTLLAEDFQFIFPVVGPLDKTEFVKAFSGFKTEVAFPDAKANFFNFNVDPTEPNRVWFMSRAEQVHSGPLNFGGRVIPATNKTVYSPPQAMSFSFDRSGKCYKMTGGYPVDRTAGNTGGLGGLFGVLHAVGQTLPFPEGKPWKPSPQWEALYRRVPQIANEWKRLFQTTH
eukprot:CAMPEP_0184478882 /NCGR_PEP_ID=MMETSP0113_2-20130426/776_1 /TAXON_ID=91329 /ORGANISM="Norrisiella sphaerica, Strain BC52" /LENGTH=286 /DNA_ID=CAMNT_0026856813 /DNA_START=113 /DNA_END=973 /DNA_ORIENTATION=+